MDELDDCCSVIFYNVKEYYSPDKVINCQFSIKKDTAINDPSNSYVGILRVAWESLDSAVAKKSFTLVELQKINGSGLYNLAFEPTETPNSNFDEFYQFCFYNIKTEAVFGASCPFQICEGEQEKFEEIKDPSQNLISSLTKMIGEGDVNNWWLVKENEKTTEEDLEDTVVIHNKTTMMETALANAVKEKEQAIMVTKLEFENKLKQCSSEKQEIIENIEADMTNLKERNQSLLNHEMLLKQNLAESQKVIKHLTSKIAEMEKIAAENSQNALLEKGILTKTFSDKDAANTEYVNKLKRENLTKQEEWEKKYNRLNKSLIAEKEKYERMEFEYEEIVSSLKKEIEQFGIKENESAEISRSYADLQITLKGEVNHKYELLDEIDKLTESVDTLSEEVKLKDLLLETEHNKLVILSAQQQEMSSRLSSENEKILSEIQKLKTEENDLMEAHRKELQCHKNRISEMETIAKEDKKKHKNDIEHMNTEIDDKIHCINILEAKLKLNDETVTQFTQTEKQVKLDLLDTVDELKTKLSELEKENAQLKHDINKASPKGETGSMYALQIANTHLQKQLKKEKERNPSPQKTVDMNDTVAKENEEMKLRLCMGKKAYDDKFVECQKVSKELKLLRQSISTSGTSGNEQSEDTKYQEQYDSLLLKFNNLRADTDTKIDELVSEVQVLRDQKESCDKELCDITADRDNAIKLNNELKEKWLRLVDHYEGKINLLEEENGMLKTQRSELLKGGSASNIAMQQPSPDVVQTAPSVVKVSSSVRMRTDMKSNADIQYPDIPEDIRRSNKVVDRQPDIATTIYHPPAAATNEKIVERQPTYMPNVMYPPSLTSGSSPPQDIPQTILRLAKQNAPTAPVTQHPLINNEPPQVINIEPPSQVINTEPPSQVIPNRDDVRFEPPMRSDTSILNGRGISLPVYQDIPTQQCPICSLDFPDSFNESKKTEHVNSHFQ